LITWRKPPASASKQQSTFRPLSPRSPYSYPTPLSPLVFLFLHASFPLSGAPFLTSHASWEPDRKHSAPVRPPMTGHRQEGWYAHYRVKIRCAHASPQMRVAVTSGTRITSRQGLSQTLCFYASHFDQECFKFQVLAPSSITAQPNVPFFSLPKGPLTFTF